MSSYTDSTDVSSDSIPIDIEGTDSEPVTGEI